MHLVFLHQLIDAASLFRPSEATVVDLCPTSGTTAGERRCSGGLTAGSRRSSGPSTRVLESFRIRTPPRKSSSTLHINSVLKYGGRWEGLEVEVALERAPNYQLRAEH